MPLFTASSLLTIPLYVEHDVMANRATTAANNTRFIISLFYSLPFTLSSLIFRLNDAFPKPSFQYRPYYHQREPAPPPPKLPPPKPPPMLPPPIPPRPNPPKPPIKGPPPRPPRLPGPELRLERRRLITAPHFRTRMYLHTSRHPYCGLRAPSSRSSDPTRPHSGQRREA